MTDAGPAGTSSASVARRRSIAAVILLALIAAGLIVHALMPDTAATDIAGDALYPLAAYAALVLVAPRLPAFGVGAITLAWCVAVELFQLTGVPQAAASVFPPAVLVLGTVFDPRDLVVYAVTTVAVTVLDASCAESLLSRLSHSLRAARKE